MSPKFNIKGKKTKQTMHIFILLFLPKIFHCFGEQSQLSTFPGDQSLQKRVLFSNDRGNFSAKSLRTFSSCSLTFKAPCISQASNFLSKIVTQSTENSKSKLHPSHLLWSLPTHSFYCFSEKPQKKNYFLMILPYCCLMSITHKKPSPLSAEVSSIY